MIIISKNKEIALRAEREREREIKPLIKSPLFIKEVILKSFGFLFNHFDVIIKSSSSMTYMQNKKRIQKQEKYLLMVYDLIV
jgi:hypothetical protein